jgi:DNA polymerase
VLVFGKNGISTLLRNGSTNNAVHLPFVNHSGAIVPSLTAYDLEAIVARPALKAALWDRWLEFMPDRDAGMI